MYNSYLIRLLVQGLNAGLLMIILIRNERGNYNNASMKMGQTKKNYTIYSSARA